MASVPVTTIDATGAHVPTMADMLAYFRTQFRGIYGDDVVLDNSTQDGQWVALIAQACKDLNDAIGATYNAFSPSTAQGTGLSSVVKINGLRRKIPTYSTCDVLIEGQATSVVSNGIIADANGTRWTLPPVVVIPFEGQVLVTATAVAPGAIVATPNTLTTIITPTLGWQKVRNPAAATVGQPVEKDPELRARQRLSTGIPAATVLEGLVGTLLALSDVTHVRAYENDQNAPDATTGIPGHSIALVVDGGDITEVAQTILRKKAPGVGTYGNILYEQADAYGIPHAIRFFRPKPVRTAFYITLRGFTGYTAEIQDNIKQALADYINAIGIGNALRLTRAYLPANLRGGPGSDAFEIINLIATRDGAAPGAAEDIVPAFNEVLQCTVDDINITALLT